MHLKFVTLNIWNGGRLLAEAREFLRQAAADLIFIQEAYNGHGTNLNDRFKTVEILQSDFSDFYTDFAPAYGDIRAMEGLIDDGQLILSRWPIAQTENIFLDLPYGQYDQDKIAATQNPEDFKNFPSTIQKANLNLPTGPVRLLNVHGPVNHAGQEDDQRRLHFAALILANLTSQTIVAGDFNVQRQTQTIKQIEAKLTNVFGDELMTSFNVNQKDLVKYPGYAQATVDMVLVTPQIQVISHACPQMNISDHLPLVVELEID